MSTRNGGVPKHDAKQLKQIINKNYTEFQTVPKSGPFVANNVDLCGPQIRRYEEEGHVTEIGHVEYNRRSLYVWELNPQMSNMLDEHEPTRSLMPCGHGQGFTNERETIYLKCNVCDGRFTAEEVAEYRENNDE